VSEAPWHAILNKFAHEFKHNANEVFDAVAFYAERNRMYHLGVTDLVKKGKYAEISKLLLDGEKHAEKVFSE
jgi:hypothetical protein